MSKSRRLSAPTVSVIIRACRPNPDILQALASVLAQTFVNFEVIVVDDGSPDALELEAVELHHARIRYVVCPNRGVSAALNTGVRASRARLIAFLDADDRWAPEFLARQVSFLEANRACALVYCDALITGEMALPSHRISETVLSNEEPTLLNLIREDCEIVLSTVVVRRRTLVAAGLFDETLRRGQDVELWLRLALRGARIRHQRGTLAERRMRADGRSGDSVADIERTLNVLERFGRANMLEAAARTVLRIRMMALIDRLEIEQARHRFVEGHFAAARYHLSASHDRPWKVRLALVALNVAPRLIWSVYRWLRPRSRRSCRCRRVDAEIATLPAP
jgi:glycosyltransferase involved in cell wall biosynthesis